MIGRALSLVLALAPLVVAAPIEASKVFELLKKGAALSAPEAAKLEERLAKKPDDPQARIQLLSFYATVPAGLELTAVKAARVKHVLWLIEGDPVDGFGLYQVSTGVQRVNCRGDQLADAQGAGKVIGAWMEKMRASPAERRLRDRAVAAAEFCQPEEAERILIEFCDNAGLGRLYANAILGVAGRSYTGSDASGTDAALRVSPFAEAAKKALATTTDKDMLEWAARTMLQAGANLWADGKLDWDYLQFGRALLFRAKAQGAEGPWMATLPTALPARGERPPQTIRVGGNVMAKNIDKSVPPRYPTEARRTGIEGTVRFEVIVGLDGAIAYMQLVSGPPALVEASATAVRQWRYKPTMLNGKPVYVQTMIDVNYRLTP